MNVASISAAGLSQYVLASSDSNLLQDTMQSLQKSLTSGDQAGAQSAFQTLQTLIQNSATASGNTLASNSQLTTDLAAVGSAVNSGDLSTALSAFAAVQTDLKNSPPPVTVDEATAASQSVQLVEGLLSTLNSSGSSSTADSTTSLLESVYGNGSGLNVQG